MLIIFDLDGTLIDSTDDLASSANAALAALSLPARSREEIRSFIGEGARRLIERAVAPRTDLVDRALAAFLEHYADNLVVATRAYGGVPELLARLRGPLAVATNKPGRFARRILAELGLLDRFVAVLGGDEGPRKPDPALLDRLRALVAASREETVLVGDSRVDEETAASAGVRFVGVGWGIGSGELSARGVPLVSEPAGLFPLGG
ncbi:MAG: HAD family hydrolase [Planctomycetota bacterium]